MNKNVELFQAVLSFFIGIGSTIFFIFAMFTGFGATITTNILLASLVLAVWYMTQELKLELRS